LSGIRKGERVTQKRSEDIGLSDIWKFLVRRRLIVAAGIVAGCAIGLLMYVRAPRLYTATAIVEMSPQGNGLEELAGASELVGEGSEFMTDMLTQEAVLMDESTALSVIQRLNLMDAPPYNALVRGRSENAVSALRQDNVVMDRALGIFRTGLKTVPITNTRLLAVSYTDRNPGRAAAIANAVVDAFLENHTRNRYDATVKASSWLTDQLDALRRHAEDIHGQVATLEKKSGVMTMPVPVGQPGTGGGNESINSNPEYQRLGALNDELGRAEIARIEKEAVYRLAQTNDSDAILGLSGTQLLENSGGALDPRNSSMQALHTLRSEEENLKVRLAAEQVRHGVRNPIIVEIQQQIAAIEGQISDELTRMNAATKADYLLAKANEDALRQDVDATKAHLMALGDDLSTLIFLRDEEATSRKLYEDLYTRLEEANITAGVNSSGMTIDVAARVPTGTSSPVLRNYLVGGLGGGLFAGILIGLLIQAADTLLYSAEDFERFSPYPLLGIIPAFQLVPSTEPRTSRELIEPQGEKEAWIVRAPKSQIAEGYRQIRTSILLSSVDSPPRVLLVTSAFSGDGKTTTAYNLAAAFATQSTKVLLVGADMRHPSIPAIPGFATGKGLSDVLSQGIQLDEVLQPHPTLPALHILHAGTIPPDPAELLGSKRFAELMKTLRAAYDYIIIDAPPVIPVTDPVIAGAAADAIVTVVRSGLTRKPDLKEMWAALDKPGITILGFMVNGYRGQLRSYRYEYDQRPERPRSRWRR
jgi:polysaccharide biosynthesis transport protein